MARPDRTRRAVLDAATLVLSKDSGASLAEVATVAGVGRTTLHRYFPTREALVRALVGDALDHVAQAITDAKPQEGPVPEALQRIADSVIPQGPSLRFLYAEPIRLCRPRNDASLVRRTRASGRGRSTRAKRRVDSRRTCRCPGSSTSSPAPS